MHSIKFQPGLPADVMPVHPAVTVILPFEPHLRSKTAIENEFQACVSKAIVKIDEDYQNALGKLMEFRLKRAFSQLNFSYFKKSVAIFVSPVFEKIIYIPFAVKATVTVSSSFDIRQILEAKIKQQSFLVVNLGRSSSNIFLSDGISLTRLNMNIHNSQITKDVLHKDKSSTYIHEHRDQLFCDLMHRTDQVLQLLLKAYPLPVIITGSAKVIGRFRKIASNTSRIVRYIQGFFAEANEQQLKKMLAPVLNEWTEIQEKDLLQRLNAADCTGHLAIGIREVWRNASARNVSLLIVEENYIPAAIMHLLKSELFSNRYSLINNVIDDIIEKVLEADGDVELVKPGTLAGYEPIVLIKRYAS